MSNADSPQTHNRRELRKALIRLRMEMHRQEIRHESTQVMRPLHRMRGMANNLPGSLGIKHGPLWGMGAVSLLGFLSGKGARSKRTGKVSRIIKVGASLMPILRFVLQSAGRRH